MRVDGAGAVLSRRDARLYGSLRVVCAVLRGPPAKPDPDRAGGSLRHRASRQAGVMSDQGLGVPNGFLDVMSLAGIIIFAITSVSAVLSSIFVKKDNLFYLGTQAILLSLFLRLAAHWTYPAWFAQ